MIESDNLGIQISEDVPRNAKGNVDWLKLKQNPDLLLATLEAEAQRFVTGGVHLSQASLVSSGLDSFRHAIYRYYPGGFVALKEKLEIKPRVPNDYSKIVEIDENGIPRDQRGRMFLAVLKDKPEELVSIIETEARRLMTEGIEITGKNLVAHRMSGFVASIQKYYPGGMISLREKLGNPVDQKPYGYWHDPANIEKEARHLAIQGNTLTEGELNKIGMGTLSQAVHKHYPGGLRQLRENLGLNYPIKHSSSEWKNTGDIESEVEKFINQGKELTQANLNKAGLSGLVTAIRQYYPGGIRAVKGHFGIVVDYRPIGYWQNPENIEAEAQELLKAGNPLTQSSLNKAGLSSMNDAIRKYYPGGMRGLRTHFDLEAGKKPNGYWAPEIIEKEALEFYQQAGRLTSNELAKNKRQDLLGAIHFQYPGGIVQLKTNLGIELSKKPDGHWTLENIRAEAMEFHQSLGSLSHALLKKNGRSDLATAISGQYSGGMTQLQIDLGLRPNGKYKYWTQERIEEEAKEFVSLHGTISQKLLAAKGRNDLSGAISGHYPGRFGRLKDNLGLERSKPAGYWTPEGIEQEAAEFYQKQGTLSQKELSKEGRADLIAAIGKNYPGGLYELQKKLGIENTFKPAGYWNPQTIEEEASKLLEQEGGLSSELLHKKGILGLAAAVPKYYPGGMRALRAKLGIPSTQRLPGYWQNPDNIEAEARKLLARGVPISQRTIYQAGVGSLNGAISNHYPGGMAGLKEKLGLVNEELVIVNPDDANQQLSRLLEEEL